MQRRKLEFPTDVKERVRARSGNRCERCGIDFDHAFKGEYHHIKPVVLRGGNDVENCSLLCHNCHLVAPNIKDSRDLLLYEHYFLRFASFREASGYFNVDTRFDLYLKLANELALKNPSVREICREIVGA